MRRCGLMTLFACRRRKKDFVGGLLMKKQAFNPYLPSWEYVPDGEPYVFDGRVYVYGSHDLYNGQAFCLGDYVGWSAPVDDLGNWRYEGITYPRMADPANDGRMVLYAPDVTIGPDGRYYMYYCLDKVPIVSVAVCDTPAGKYEFYGHVHYADGTRLGEREGDEPQFDPGVITEDGKTYLYTGFCGMGDKSRTGSFCTVLDSDMLTIIQDPVRIIPGCMYSTGTEYEGHAFFEASSIRKRGDTYYYIYSSQVMHELCYATSKRPDGDFKYGGVIVSNCDVGIDSYKPKEMITGTPGNDHGSIVQIGDDWYIFYHRQTNGTWFSRQGCAEKIKFEADGSIKQAEMTSCGLNGGPLVGKGEYPTYICCNLFNKEVKASPFGAPNAAKIIMDGRDGDEELGYVYNVKKGDTIGFKYFDCKGITKVRVITRGYSYGYFEVRTKWDGEVLGTIKIESSNFWEAHEADIAIPDGVNALYFTFCDGGSCSFKSFELI